MQNRQHADFLGPDSEKGTVGKAFHERPPDVAMHLRGLIRIFFHSQESLLDGFQEGSAESRRLAFVPPRRFLVRRVAEPRAGARS